MVITDVQSALDVLMTAKYEIGTNNIVIDKALITEDFFVLSTGLAGRFCKNISIMGDALRSMETTRTIQVNLYTILFMKAIRVKMCSLLQQKMKLLMRLLVS